MKLIQMNEMCQTCHNPILNRSKLKLDPKKRNACKECGNVTKNEPTIIPTEIRNPVLSTNSSRVPEKLKKWRFKQYTPQQAAELGIALVNWTQQNPQVTSAADFLVDIARCSYLKLERMAVDCPELAEALEIANEIFAERVRKEWKEDERMDINKYSSKMFDLLSPLVKIKEEKRHQIEVSSQPGIPYFDPTYPNLNKSE